MKYEILYLDKHTEIVDEQTVDTMINELEMFERTDVSQIHELEEDGTLGRTIWTEEEGLFVSDFDLPCKEDDDYYEIDD